MNRIYKQLVVMTFISMVAACSEAPEASLDSVDSNDTVITIERQQFTSSNFELGKVEQRRFSKLLRATGSIHLPDKSRASVSTLMNGTIGKINLVKGQWVQKGQVLFTVTNPELINLQEEYLISTGQLEYLTEEYARQQELSNENLTTNKDLLKSKSELTTMQARHGSLAKKLNLYGINTDNLEVSNLVTSLTVRAPISGYVSAINVMQGTYLTPEQSAVTLDNTSAVHLELSVLEKDAMMLADSQKVKFTLQGSANTQYNATIELISKSINERHMITVHCNIDDDIENLVPGMFASAEVILESYEASALPETALVKMDDIHYGLHLIKTDESVMSFSKMPMKVGVVENGYIELLESTTTDMEFLTKGAYFLIQ